MGVWQRPGLCCDDCVVELQHAWADWGRPLLAACDCNDDGRKDEVLKNPAVLPSREPARLAIVTIIGEEELGTDEQNTAVECHHPAVVARPVVHDWHSEIAYDSVGVSILEELCKSLPAVFGRVFFQEMVLHVEICSAYTAGIYIAR